MVGNVPHTSEVQNVFLVHEATSSVTTTQSPAGLVHVGPGFRNGGVVGSVFPQQGLGKGKSGIVQFVGACWSSVGQRDVDVVGNVA